MRIGIDLGGTKTEAIALDEDGTELGRIRVATPRHDYEASIRQMAELVKSLESETGRSGSVGIGGPGAVSPVSNRMKNANSVWLNDKPLAHDLSTAMGRPVRYANDANCLAISEATDGAGAGARVVLAFIIGTGSGSGIAIDARVHTGPNATAGEWAHNPLPWMRPGEFPGHDCWCGKQGCLETWISGIGLEQDFEREAGNTKSAAEISAAAADGEPQCAAAMDRYEDRLGRGMAQVVNNLDPDVIVLGGGISNIDRLYSTLPQIIPRYVFGGDFLTPIRKASHGDSSGVRGAAWLWPKGEA